MKMTRKRAEVIIRRYHELCTQAEYFLDSIKDKEHAKFAFGHGMSNTQLDWDGGVIYERNVACNCHPEMRTFKQPAERFFQWLG
jgi:hypothetical protein